MRIIDLTQTVEPGRQGWTEVERYIHPLSVRGEAFRGVCYRMTVKGMLGTYLDFPGHIEEFDDGCHAGNAPIEDLAMLETTVIHLDPARHAREVTAAELDAAGVEVKGTALILHALGLKSLADFPRDQAPYLDRSAIEWLIARRIRVIASDVYEKFPDQQGVFVELFRHGIWTVCEPVNLRLLTQSHCRTCVIPLRMTGLTQLPCRFFAVES